MLILAVALALMQTQMVDDPFESSVLYLTRLDPAADKPSVVYSGSAQCSFLQVSDRAFASSKKRGAKPASSFFEFKLTALYRETCGSPLSDIDITQGRYVGGMEADVDARSISSNCAITICKHEYSVSVRLSTGMASRNDEVLIKFGAPHETSFVVGFPMKRYLEHRADVLR
jgi:hypothetical protein